LGRGREKGEVSGKKIIETLGDEKEDVVMWGRVDCCSLDRVVRGCEELRIYGCCVV
jgi:hypothetical protein